MNLWHQLAQLACPLLLLGLVHHDGDVLTLEFRTCQEVTKEVKLQLQAGGSAVN